ncbi:MAG: hypothetical protein ACFB10_25110, partial [Salibacteraceae bacterium]
MRLILSYLLSTLLFLVCSVAPVIGQDIAELEKTADGFFEKQQYAEALPLYSQLLANFQENPDYNYHYGTCVLYAEENKFDAISYLAFACKSEEVPAEAYFQLGKAYQLNYEFKRALVAYEKFKSKTNGKQQAQYNVEREIETCTNGRNLLRNISDISVTEKNSLKLEDFAKAYNMEAFGGKIIRKTEDFKLKYDKKIDEESVMYFQKNSDYIYFSSYGDKGENGRDIYFVKRQPNGDWSDPEPLSSVINTPYDEHYPFIHPNGNKLYFASKGHNSMGGYDIFETTRDPNTGRWSKPVNLDFAVNTPDDDFLLITDEEEKTAYFASTRESALGEVTVYKIHLNRVPFNETLIKGQFKSEESLSATITVLDAETEKEVGIYQTDRKTGEYAISLPNGGTFLFVVEMKGSSIAHKSSPIKLPKLKNPRPLKQEMQIIRDEKDYEKLLVNNAFDEQLDVELALTAELLRQKASLNVGDSPPPPGPGPSLTIVDDENNTAPTGAAPLDEGDDPEPTVVENEEPAVAEVTETPVEDTEEGATPENEPTNDNTSPSTTDEVATAAGDSETNVSVAAAAPSLAQKAYANAQLIEDQVTALETSAGIALALSQEKSSAAKTKNEAAEAILGTLSSVRNKEEKQKKSDEAYILKKQSQQFSEEAKLAIELSEELEALAQERSQQQITAEQYAREIETEAGTAPESELQRKLEKSAELVAQAKGPTSVEELMAERQKDSEAKRNEALAELKKARELEEEARRLEEEIAYFNTESEDRKNKDMAEQLKAQAAESEASLAEIRSEQQQGGTKAVRLKEEAERFAMMASVSEDLNEAANSPNPPEPVEMSSGDKQNLRSELTLVSNQVEEERTDLVIPGAEDIFITDTEIDQFDDLESVVAVNGYDDPDPIESPPPAAADPDPTPAPEATADRIADADPATTTPETETPATDEPAPVVDAAVLMETIADDFEPRLFEQEAESDEMVREAAKAEIYSEWAQRLELEAGALRQQLTSSAEPDPELEQRIARLDGEARRKRKLADESYETIAAMSDSNDAEALAENAGNGEQEAESTDNENLGFSVSVDAPSNYTESFENQVAEAEAIPEASEREAALAQIHNNWQSAIDEEIGELQESRPEASPAEQNIIDDRIARLETESQTQAEEGARHSESALALADASPEASPNAELPAGEPELATADNVSDTPAATDEPPAEEPGSTLDDQTIVVEIPTDAPAVVADAVDPANGEATPDPEVSDPLENGIDPEGAISNATETDEPVVAEPETEVGAPAIDTETPQDPEPALADNAGTESEADPTQALTEGEGLTDDPFTEVGADDTDPAEGNEVATVDPAVIDPTNLDPATLPISAYDQTFEGRLDNLSDQPEDRVIVKRLEVNREWLT